MKERADRRERESEREKDIKSRESRITLKIDRGKRNLDDWMWRPAFRKRKVGGLLSTFCNFSSSRHFPVLIQ